MAIPKQRVRYERPEVLSSKTYKVRSPVLQHALYITIGDGIVDEQPRPVEVFIMTKDMQGMQMLTAVTRLLSVQLQQVGNFPKFVIDELKETYDPQGGYFIPGGKKVNGIVSHLGLVLEEHCKALGVFK